MAWILANDEALKLMSPPRRLEVAHDIARQRYGEGYAEMTVEGLAKFERFDKLGRAAGLIQ